MIETIFLEIGMQQKIVLLQSLSARLVDRQWTDKRMSEVIIALKKHSRELGDADRWIGGILERPVWVDI